MMTTDIQTDYFTPCAYMQGNDVIMHKFVHACTCTHTAKSFAGENFTKPSYPFIVAETLRGIIIANTIQVSISSM